MRPPLRGVLLMLSLVSVSLAAARRPVESGDVGELLSRLADRLEQYYARAQSIICDEKVRFQTLGTDFSWDGSHVREVVYELRVAWAPPTDDNKVPDAS